MSITVPTLSRQIKYFEKFQLKKIRSKNHLKLFKNEFDTEPTTESIFNGFLNKRPGNPENDLHRAIDSMESEVNGGTASHTAAKNIEDLKGRRFKELSTDELKEWGEINANQDRFRHRIIEQNYMDDIKKGGVTSPNFKWIE